MRVDWYRYSGSLSTVAKGGFKVEKWTRAGHHHRTKRTNIPDVLRAAA